MLFSVFKTEENALKQFFELFGDFCLENNKKDFVELSREIVVDFLKSQKSVYRELVIDMYCNFKEVIDNYELFVR